MKKFFACFSALAVLACIQAETVKLKNGDRISGHVSMAQFEDPSASKLEVKTLYGSIEIPKADIDSVIPAEKAAEEAKVIAEAMSPKPAEEAKAPVVRTWEDDYKDFIHSIVPSGWEFKFSGGLEYKNSTSKNLSYVLALTGKKKWDEFNEFDFNMWYDYATEEPDGQPKTTSTDKYGIMTNYKRFLGRGDDWFLKNMLGYSVDRVKLINDQVDEGVLFGRKFKFLENDAIVINLALGPAVRYTNADGYDQHWAAMGTATEDFTWKFHKYSRIEQSAYFGLNATNWNRYNLDFRLGIVFDVTEIVSLSCRYIYTYDNMTADDAQKSEQRLVAGFEIPFK